MKSYESKEFLIARLKTKKYFEIAKEFGISKTTIQRNLNKFGLTKRRRKWPKKEITLLKKTYGVERKLKCLFPSRTTIGLY